MARERVFFRLRDLGDRVRARRVAPGLTKAQLAESCALHRTFIGSVERGERNVSMLNPRTMARTLRISLAERFEGLPDRRARGRDGGAVPRPGGQAR